MATTRAASRRRTWLFTTPFAGAWRTLFFQPRIGRSSRLVGVPQMSTQTLQKIYRPVEQAHRSGRRFHLLVVVLHKVLGRALQGLRHLFHHIDRYVGGSILELRYIADRDAGSLR